MPIEEKKLGLTLRRLHLADGDVGRRFTFDAKRHSGVPLPAAQRHRRADADGLHAVQRAHAAFELANEVSAPQAIAGFEVPAARRALQAAAERTFGSRRRER